MADQFSWEGADSFNWGGAKAAQPKTTSKAPVPKASTPAYKPTPPKGPAAQPLSHRLTSAFAEGIPDVGDLAHQALSVVSGGASDAIAALANLVGRQFGYRGPDPSLGGATRKIIHAGPNPIGQTPGDKPQSTGEDIAQRVLRGTPTALVAPLGPSVGRGLVTSLAANVGQGVGGGVAHKLAPNNQLAELGGQLVGGGLAGRAAHGKIAPEIARTFDNTPPVRVAKAVRAVVDAPHADDDAKAAVAIHRRNLGTRGTQADKEIYDLSKHAKPISKLDEQGVVNFIDHVENKPGARDTPLPAPLQKAADAFGSLAKRYEDRIKYVVGDKDVSGKGPSFIKDYYSHLWKQDPATVERAMSGFSGKQGSGRSLKQRTIPYYSDGLAAGLTPRYANPVENMNAYIENMARFLGTHDIHNEMVESGLAKTFKPGTQPEGWVRLNGMLSRKPSRPYVDKDGNAKMTPERYTYAPEGAARIYNRHISQGMEKNAAYRGARALTNAMVQLKLGLSTFHAATMGQEGIVSETAKGLGQLSRGKPIQAAKTIAKAPFAPITTALKGRALTREVLGENAPSEMGQKIADLHAKAGGRLNMDRVYGTRASGSFFNSYLRGTLKKDVGGALKATYKGTMLEKAKGITDLAGNIIQSTAAPLFEKYVPWMKRGAFASQMQAYLKENPDAPQSEQEAFARKTLDNIDNRFGEMIQDNLFWDKSAAEISRLLLLSPSWNLGTIREIGGGIAEMPKSMAGILKGKGVTPKTAYVAALLGVTALQNAIQTKLHTGDNPEGMDFLAYRTGGIDPSGQPERALIPGYMKDILSLTLGDPRQEAINKLSPALSTTVDLAENKDWRGLPIYHEKTAPEPGDSNALSFIAEQAAPIGPEQMLGPRKQGSNLSTVERLLAVKPAPRYLTDPEGTEAGAEKREQRAWKAKRKADARAESQLEQPKKPSPKLPMSELFTWEGTSEPISWEGASTPIMKAGATAGGSIRPEMKPVVSIATAMPGFKEVTAENDTYHPANDVHGQGKAMDFTIKGGANAAPDFVRRLKKKFADEGLSVYVRDEYNNPSAGATGGHIHVSIK